MPRLPRITGVELVAKLRRGGWVVKRIKGSHHQLEHRSGGRSVTIPVHGSRTLQPSILRGIIRSTGLTVDELIDL